MLFIDTETGGIDPNIHSILSIGLVSWTDGLIDDETEILINEDQIIATKEALSINNIDIESHKKIAINCLDAVKQIENFCIKNFSNEDKITLAGHNICFDVGFLKRLYQKANTEILATFSHRYIDTASILKYLYVSKILPEDLSASDTAFEYFNIKISKRHSALEDAKATALLFNELIKLLKAPL
ncbi:MAG: 3'-5' exonuclease [Cyanobacteriota bacterium]